MPRVRSARAHEQVLIAAQELFSERGIDGASMDAIAATSGVSKRTLYNHFAVARGTDIQPVLQFASPLQVSRDLRSATSD